jgi:predicted nuclease with TOPRIM domain
MSEPLSELRQALDDAVLTHTGRSIGDLASQRVLDDIMPLLASEVDHLQMKLSQCSEQFDKLSTQYTEARERWKQMMERERAQLARVMPIVEAVAGKTPDGLENDMTYDSDFGDRYCIFGCEYELYNERGSAHAPDCPVTQARAALEQGREASE